MKPGSIPTGQAIFHIALRAGKRIVPNAVYLIGFLRFQSGSNLCRRGVMLRTGGQQKG
jgi:hypothetical protein